MVWILKHVIHFFTVPLNGKYKINKDFRVCSEVYGLHLENHGANFLQTLILNWSIILLALATHIVTKVLKYGEFCNDALREQLRRMRRMQSLSGIASSLALNMNHTYFRFGITFDTFVAQWVVSLRWILSPFKLVVLSTFALHCKFVTDSVENWGDLY